ncbi:Nucleotidyl transferase [uncultured Desulfobacterium sp.]|uniref:Nucleotidyl transferase n=1 Tax=uncultured Desulfobacterium sp. TaxID=201089 RepID=A0A445N3Z5_9BACT|nr:Nucleotidyl transferase [uncultured Desulfobacterium sp.]
MKNYPEGILYIMKAMILAAGLGTRLRPLTSHTPKPLVPVGNRPVIDLTLEHLKRHGVYDVIVNAHHCHQELSEYLDGGRPFGMDIEVRVEPDILGTGGGMKNTEDFWDHHPFFVVNGDIITDINLTEALSCHLQSKNLVTLILHDYHEFNQIEIDDSRNIVDIGDRACSGRLAFSGIHIIEPELLDCIPEGVFYNIIDCYKQLIKSGRPVRAYVSEGHYWRDIGSIKSYLDANKEALRQNPFLFGPDLRMHGSVRLIDWAVIGEGACLEEDSEVRGSVLWKGVTVKKGIRIIDSVVTSHRQVEKDLIGETY